MAKAEIEYPNPAVYKALANVLKHLSVEKNGKLPGNMSGKPYITASDAAAEVKRQFVAENLIFLPSEKVITHENMFNNNRLQVSVVVTGEYTIVSTEDGSSVTVSGTGDGLATGTAVASNIASTNALKNALLRTFLITEQSVEDAGKDGISGGAPNSPLEKARNQGPKTPAKAPAKKGTTENVKALVRAAIDDPDNPLTSDQANKTWDEIAKRLGQEKGHPETLATLKVELGL